MENPKSSRLIKYEFEVTSLQQLKVSSTVSLSGTYLEYTNGGIGTFCTDTFLGLNNSIP